MVLGHLSQEVIRESHKNIKVKRKKSEQISD